MKQTSLLVIEESPPQMKTRKGEDEGDKARKSF